MLRVLRLFSRFGIWWGLINQVLTIYKEDIRKKLQDYDYDSD